MIAKKHANSGRHRDIPSHLNPGGKGAWDHAFAIAIGSHSHLVVAFENRSQGCRIELPAFQPESQPNTQRAHHSPAVSRNQHGAGKGSAQFCHGSSGTSVCKTTDPDTVGTEFIGVVWVPKGLIVGPDRNVSLSLANAPERSTNTCKSWRKRGNTDSMAIPVRPTTTAELLIAGIQAWAAKLEVSPAIAMAAPAMNKGRTHSSTGTPERARNRTIETPVAMNSPRNPQMPTQIKGFPNAAAHRIPTSAVLRTAFELIALVVPPSAIAARVGVTRIIRSAHMAANQPITAPAASYLGP